MSVDASFQSAAAINDSGLGNLWSEILDKDAVFTESERKQTGGTLNAESGLTRFTVRYMVTHHYFNIQNAYRDFCHY